MANDENLKKGKRTRFKSGEEAAKYGRKGGVASGESRRRKKAMKERLQEALDLSVTNPNVKKMMQVVGMDGDGTNYDAVVASIIAGTIQGRPGYARLLAELLGEIGAEQNLNVAVSVPIFSGEDDLKE